MKPIENKQLVRESEWMRVYRIGPNELLYESKFLIDRLSVPATLIKGRWIELTPEEQLEFAQAFSCKAELSSEDEQILDFLMERGSEEVLQMIAPLLPRCSHRERVLEFLLGRIEHGSKGFANYFQALEIIGDRRAVAVLRLKYEQYRKEIVQTGRTGIATRDLLGYLSCTNALLTLEGSEEYKAALREMLGHPDSVVHLWAQRFLTQAEG